MKRACKIFQFQPTSECVDNISRRHQTKDSLNSNRTTLFCLDSRRLAKSQYPEGPETGHLDTGFSWFPCVLEQMLGWFQILPSYHYMLHM